ncbi:hypothetical protein ACJX0J_034646, partial [Zea mays]
FAGNESGRPVASAGASSFQPFAYRRHLDHRRLIMFKLNTNIYQRRQANKIPVKKKSFVKCLKKSFSNCIDCVFSIKYYIFLFLDNNIEDMHKHYKLNLFFVAQDGQQHMDIEGMVKGLFGNSIFRNRSL